MNRKSILTAVLAATLAATMSITATAAGQTDNSKEIEAMSRWLDGLTVTPSADTPAGLVPRELTDEELAAYTDKIFELVNKEREKAGAEPLERSEYLDEAANTRAMDCAAMNSIYVDGKDGGDYVEVTTDTQGTAVVNGLTDEWYSVTEVRSPTGYLLDDTPQVVQLLPGKTTTIKINNHKKPSLTIKKIDEQTGAAIPGVVLRITKDGAMEYRDVTTGADGTAVITDMEPG